MTPLVTGRSFLEGPRWRSDALYVSDMHGDVVLRVTADGATSTVVEVDQPSGLGWLPDGSMLISSMASRRVMRWDGSALVVHADLATVAPFEINDMVVDRRGHAFVGQFGYDLRGGARPVDAPLLRVDPDGSVHEAAPALRMANGMAIANDDRTLVVAESSGKCLVGFTVADDGTLTDRRIWAELPDHPDGICLDAEDGVWIAAPVTDRFVRVAEGGAVTDVVETPGRHGIACALGGPDGRTLYMCTSTTHGARDDSRAAMTAAVETTTVQVPGAERP
ncbi:MAG: SMP-30/gluconolactonase/LRE family protein [Actinobacteria bacterium]|nr:SMP-30/gluconolactonase/LRE family protein [Actinomycetota bacterium]